MISRLPLVVLVVLKNEKSISVAAQGLLEIIFIGRIVNDSQTTY